MRIAELRKEMGLPDRARSRCKGAPTVVLAVCATLPRAQAESVLDKMQTDDIGMAELFRRLLCYYIADHDGYKVR